MRFVPPAVALLSVAGSFVSFEATGSQAQFTALNALFFAGAGLCALVALTFRDSPEPTVGWKMLDAFTLSVVACLAWALIASLVSGRFPTAFFGESTSQVGLASIIGVIALAAVAHFEAKAVRAVITLLAPIVIIAQGVWALARPGDIVDATHAGFGNSSALGFALVILLPWVLSPSDAEEPAKPKRGSGDSTGHRSLGAWGGVFQLLVALFAVFVAFRAQARLAIGLMLATLLWFALNRLVKSARVRRQAFLAGSLLGVAGAGALAFLERAGRLPFGFLTIRYGLWQSALDAAMRRPLLGYGADGFFSAGASVAVANGGRSGAPFIFTDGTTDPHNLIVFAGVSFGIIGVILLLTAFVAWFSRVGLNARSMERFDPGFVSVLAGLVLLMTMPVTLDILPLFALVTGLSLRAKAEQPVPVTRQTRSLTRFGLALGAIALAVFAANAAGRVSLGAVSYFAPAPLERSIGLARLGGWDPYFVYEANAGFGSMIVPQQELSAVTAAWERIRPARAVALDTRNPYYALSYAQALWNAGRPTAEVVSAYQDAIRKYPSFPSAHADLALVYAQAGEIEAARSQIVEVRAVGDPAGYPWGPTVAQAERIIAEAK